MADYGYRDIPRKKKYSKIHFWLRLTVYIIALIALCPILGQAIYNYYAYMLGFAPLSTQTPDVYIGAGIAILLWTGAVIGLSYAIENDI